MNIDIKVFNSLSKQYEKLETIEPGHLKMYVCGPTVYDRPHIGNARSIVVYDLFFRFFKVVYPKVTYVRNITDVDDKINNRAKEKNISIYELTNSVIKEFNEDIKALNVLKPTFEPKATEHIAEIISLIEKLIASNHAYVSKGHVLFDVNSYKNYGQLSNRALDEMIAGARVEVADYKKNPLDFVLWKPGNKGDDESSLFKSPWGNEDNLGRPGWHVECSAMSSKFLGNDFDIHGGGADLQFPHHENEIAQSVCANPNSKYAKYWIHNGFLTVNGEKMSKSLNNFFTVKDLLDKGINGTVIRYLLLVTHYSKPFDYNQKALDDADKSVKKFNSLIKDLKKEIIEENFDKMTKQIDENSYFYKILESLADDFNISKAIAILHEITKEIKKNSNETLILEFASILHFLGFYDNSVAQENTSKVDAKNIENLIAKRKQAKLDKNYALADEIRDQLLSQNITIKDNPDGSTSWTS